LIELVATQPGKAGAKANLYEIKGVNLGQFSPTQVTWARDYTRAVAALREQRDFENRVVLSFDRTDLVRASLSRFVAIRDGYRLTSLRPEVPCSCFLSSFRIVGDREQQRSSSTASLPRQHRSDGNTF
jgi:hypothetical protein